ncbi:MAG TPA: hypothetical protein VM936_11095 [Pyrinomonadaceae bacterium]|jgi:hypothetical protein|nr:hypothetical protein [Pyrinomonadaceae bacterium]
MDSFTTRAAAPASASADPTKRVNYTYGMVLGVDDFVQEQTYHNARGEWLARDLVGYGTVNGLAVSVGKTAQNETEVVVTAGAALSPRGQLIRVAPTQCANLSQWLAADSNRRAVRDAVGSPPARPARLYVVLCYRACETDRVPIPGEPCRSEENATAASRLTDDFKLELRLSPPGQSEEDALRDFVVWLEQHVQFTDEPGSFTDLQTFRDTLLKAAHPVASPPSSPPDFMHDSPPGVMRVHSSDACAFLREAFRLWVTALRPRWRPVFGTGEGHEEEECLLLAELGAPLTNAGLLDETRKVEVREERRPFVLHLRMLQEWLLCGEMGRVMGGVSSPPSGPPSSPKLDDLTDVDAAAPQANDVLTFQGGRWKNAPNAAAAGTAGGDLQGTYPNPTIAGLRGRPLSGNAPLAGQVLFFNGAQWIPTTLAGGGGGSPSGTAGGDLSGTYPNPAVAQLQARSVSNAAPNDGDTLTWNAGANQWQPMARPAVVNMLPFATVIPSSAQANGLYRFWFNLQTPGNDIAIADFPEGAVRVFAETADPAFLSEVRVGGAKPVDGQRNVFDIQLERPFPLLRFQFDLRRISAQGGKVGLPISLIKFVNDNRINYVGFTADAQVTVFVATQQAGATGGTPERDTSLKTGTPIIATPPIKRVPQ